MTVHRSIYWMFAAVKFFWMRVIHDLNDPACCPEQAVTRTFKLSGVSLTLVHATSRISGGQERVVTIESPTTEMEFRGELVVTGSVTIAAV